MCVQCRKDPVTDANDGETIAQNEPDVRHDDNDDGDDDEDAEMEEIEMLDYECDLCDTELYSTVETLNQHKRLVHGITQSDLDHDEMAMEEMKIVDTIRRAAAATGVEKTNRRTIPNPSSRQLQCQDCAAFFDNRTQLANHRTKNHPKRRRRRQQLPPPSDTEHDTNNSEDTAADNDDTGGPVNTNEFTCRLCPVDDDDGATTTKLPKFDNRAALRAHEDAEHRNVDTAQFPCTHCDRQFACASFLALHVLKHTKRKMFSCPECGRQFARLAHLQYHQSTHTDQKLFECTDCSDTLNGKSKRFKTEESLRRHRVSRMIYCF